MTQYPINNSFIFDKKYITTNEFNNEYSYIKGPIISHNNSIGLQTDIDYNHYSMVPQFNNSNGQINSLSQQGNIIEAQINSFDALINSQVNNPTSQDNSSGENINLFAQKVKPFGFSPSGMIFYPHINLKDPYHNTNIQVSDNIHSCFNYKEPHDNIKANKIYSNALSNSFPQDSNSISPNVNTNTRKNNLQKSEHILNNNQKNLKIINKGLNNRQNIEQVNQFDQYQDNSKIFDDSIQRLKQILLNQFLQMFAPQRQNQPSNNLKNMKQNQKKIDSKNTSNKKSNNQNFNLNIRGKNHINDEINSEIKELIDTNILLSLVIFISNESNVIQNTTLSELIKSNEALIKSNEIKQAILSELIKSNEEQKRHNRIMEKSIIDTLSYLKNNINNNQNNLNINSSITYYISPKNEIY